MCSYLKFDLLVFVQDGHLSYKNFSWNKMNLSIHLSCLLEFFYLWTYPLIGKDHYLIVWIKVQQHYNFFTLLDNWWEQTVFGKSAKAIVVGASEKCKCLE